MDIKLPLRSKKQQTIALREEPSSFDVITDPAEAYGRVCRPFIDLIRTKLQLVELDSVAAHSTGYQQASEVIEITEQAPDGTLWRWSANHTGSEHRLTQELDNNGLRARVEYAFKTDSVLKRISWAGDNASVEEITPQTGEVSAMLSLFQEMDRIRDELTRVTTPGPETLLTLAAEQIRFLRAGQALAATALTDQPSVIIDIPPQG